ncbi:response regulator [Spirosoma pollinicola]|uniref:response regulator n=1 Tax=Spirosoma pollinicola TaxID=2057025 RepID=UPI0012FE2BB3|nr:response regulator [Spirosoma pollinicola]
MTEFLSATSLGKDKPVALVIDGVMPNGEETKWLSTLLLHPSCQQACLIMLSAEVAETQRAAYLQLGAMDHLQKPMHLAELQKVVSTVSGHIARKASSQLNPFIQHCSQTKIGKRQALVLTYPCGDDNFSVPRLFGGLYPSNCATNDSFPPTHTWTTNNAQIAYSLPTFVNRCRNPTEPI